MSDLNHFDETGRPRMVDVSGKVVTRRLARAHGRVSMQRDTLARALQVRTKKGDVTFVAELSGIMAAKRTAELIPLSHPIGIDAVNVEITPNVDLPGFEVVAEVATCGRTGVEMEALTAVSVACLTIYDMLKAIDRGMTIEAVKLLSKEGGRSGTWSR